MEIIVSRIQAGTYPKYVAYVKEHPEITTAKYGYGEREKAVVDLIRSHPDLFNIEISMCDE